VHKNNQLLSTEVTTWTQKMIKECLTSCSTLFEGSDISICKAVRFATA